MTSGQLVAGDCHINDYRDSDTGKFHLQSSHRGLCETGACASHFTLAVTASVAESYKHG